MSYMEKLLVIADIGQRAYGKWLFQRLLPNIAVVVGLTIITSITVSAVLVGGFYTAYLALLRYGVEPQITMLIISISAVLTVVVLAILTHTCLRRLRQAPLNPTKQSPLASQSNDMLTAFFSGFMSK